MSFKVFNPGDIVEGSVTRNLTSNLWSGNVNDLTVAYTSSTQTGSDSGLYQWFIYDGDPSLSTSTVQYSVAFGDRNGGGSVKYTNASDGKTPSKAVYSQFAQLLLNPAEAESVSSQLPGFICCLKRLRFTEINHIES